MCTNKGNTVLERIVVWFLVYSTDVSNPRHITSETFDHVYGGYCMVNCDFSVLEMMQIKLEKRG